MRKQKKQEYYTLIISHPSFKKLKALKNHASLKASKTPVKP